MNYLEFLEFFSGVDLVSIIYVKYCRSFVKVYSFTFDGILSFELIVVQLALKAAIPIDATIKTLGLSGDPE